MSPVSVTLSNIFACYGLTATFLTDLIMMLGICKECSLLAGWVPLPFWNALTFGAMWQGEKSH